MKNYPILLGLLIFAISCGGEIQDPQETVGSIIGIVADKTTGDPVGTVNLSLSPGGKKTVTGSDGSFMFSDLSSGSYTIDLDKDGYKRESYSVVVFEGKQTESHLLIDRIPAIITADREVLEFGDNAGVTQLSVSIVNPGYLDLHWSVTWDNQVKWLREVIGPDGKSEGTLGYGKTASLVVRIDRDALANGYNEAVVVIWSDNGRSELKVTANGADRRTAATNVLPVSDILTNSAVLHAEVISKGSPEYVERGFVLSKSSIAHDASLASLQVVSAPINADMTYTADVSGLESGTHYYVRAYAKNDIGTKLSSNEAEFTTIGAWAEVKTLEVTSLDIVAGTALFNGEIITEGAPKYTEKGFVYNNIGEPTTADTKVTVSGSGTGKYYYSCAGLASQKTWYVRAYTIQCGKVFYGSTVNFSTNQSETVVNTSAATSVTSTSATLNGSIAQVGSPAYSERGFCYSSSNEKPSISDNKRIVTGNSTNFSIEITGLDYDRKYYYRAYAIQNGSPVYGSVVNFTTVFVPVGVTTGAVSNVSYTSARLFGNISNVGDPKYTERGFCYGTGVNPTISDIKVSQKISTAGNWTADVSGLSSGTTYYVRAYAIQNGKPVYANQVSFTTHTAPVVETKDIIGLQKIDMGGGFYYQWKVTFNGEVTNVGNPAYVAKGFVYGTSSEPRVGADTSVTAPGTGTGSYSASVNNLGDMKTYYVRAWVKKSDGKYEYGNAISFNTY